MPQPEAKSRSISPTLSPGLTLSLGRAMSFMWPYKKQIVFASIALIITAGITLGLVQYVRIIVDSGFVDGSTESLNLAIAGLVVAVLFLSIGTFTRFYWVSWLGERVTADIRQAVFSHLIELHPGYLEDTVSGEIQSRITTDTTLLQTVIGSSVSIALRNVLMLMGGIVLLFVINPKLTSVVLLCIPLIIGPILFFGRRVRKLSRSSQDEIANVGAYVGESIQQLKTVQAYNHQEADKQQFSTHVESAFSVAVERIRSRSFLIALVMTLVYGAISAMFWVGGQDVINGVMSAGELTAFVVYAVIVAGAVGSLSQVITDLQRAAGATERLMELLYAENDIVAPPNPVSFGDDFEAEIVLNNVEFYYSSRPETAAINGVNLTVAKGASLALVGPSGAGKSTLFDLLLRFYDPQHGSIELSGIDIRKLDPLELRKHIAIVTQQPAMFTGNVWDNIRYGRPDATDEQVRQAAEDAFASEFIEKLPEGYDSYLGEAGIRLSGGQRQRIAIARAILKDPEILLLDEATSALDAESERKVQEALDRLMQGRTTVVIAHRLATVMNVDSIAVMDGGQLIAQGSHQQLQQSCPLYAKLAALQFSNLAA